LNWLIIGAGAIGSYIGGSLANDGQSVTFLERRDVVEKLLRDGLRLALINQLIHIPKVRVFDSIDGALKDSNYDVVIFALKAYDTQAAIDSFASYSKDLPPFLCLQNGVDNEANLASVLGKEKVIAGTVSSAIGRREIGDIQLERKRGIGIGADHPLSQRIVYALNAADLNARLYSSPLAMKWSKMLTNLLANATCAILDMTPGEVFAHSGLYRLEIQAQREALSVMRALNIDVVDLPGVPVRLLSYAIRWLPTNFSQPLLRRAVGGGRGGKMPSLHIDLHSSRGKSEVSYLYGAVSNYAKRFALPSPVNSTLTDILMQLTDGSLSHNVYAQRPDKLIETIALAQSGTG